MSRQRCRDNMLVSNHANPRYPEGGRRRVRVPAPYPHASQTPPPSSPRKPRVGDEQGLLIGGHTHHHSATNLNIPGGCHRPPLAGFIAQHGGRGVLRRQLYADFLVCVVVVLLALLRGGESMSRQCRDILTAAFSAKGDLVVATAPLWPALSPNTVAAGCSECKEEFPF